MTTSIDDPTNSSGPETGQTFRTAGSLRFAGVYGLIGTIVLIILGIAAHNAAGRGIAFVFAGIVIVLSIRALILGVHVTNDHVRIRNMFMTRRVGWSDVERFSFGPLRAFPSVGIATLSDGRKIAMTGISVGRVARKPSRANAASLITELNQLLEEHRADASPGK